MGSYNGKTDKGKRTLGNKKYELSNHLGNVLAIISDNKIGIGTNGVADYYEPLVISESDYYPFGMAMKERSFSNEEYRFGFNGMEEDRDLGEGKTDFGARVGNKETGRWLSCDPLEGYYVGISTYTLINNNPIWLLEIDGAKFDFSNLTQKEKEDYQTMITSLKASKLFAYYYKQLEISDVVYKIDFDEKLEEGGKYVNNNKTVTIGENLTHYILAQELFHAYQNDLEIYTYLKDRSNMETEGDIMTMYVMFDVDGASVDPDWSNKIISTYGVYTVPSGEDVISKDYSIIFAETVEERIKYYKANQKENGTDFSGYTRDASSIQPKAIIKVISETDSEQEIGPRLPNGDFYSNPEK